jgi:hypothetical protein
VAEICARLASDFCQYIQQFRVGQIVLFGWLSALSQLASSVREGGGVWQLPIALHSLTLPTYLGILVG